MIAIDQPCMLNLGSIVREIGVASSLGFQIVHAAYHITLGAYALSTPSDHNHHQHEMPHYMDIRTMSPEEMMARAPPGEMPRVFIEGNGDKERGLGDRLHDFFESPTGKTMLYGSLLALGAEYVGNRRRKRKFENTIGELELENMALKKRLEETYGT